MLAKDELWITEGLRFGEASDLMTIPELKRCLRPSLREDELGFRSLLARPESLSKAWTRRERASATRRLRARVRREKAPGRA